MVVLVFLDLFSSVFFCVLFLEGSGGVARKKRERKGAKQNDLFT